MWRAIFGPKALVLSLVAILAIVICVDLGKWQWSRKVAVDQINSVLMLNLKATPLPLSEVMTDKVAPKSSDRWRQVQVSGVFLPATYYVKGRSYQAKYGYAVLSVLRCSDNGQLLWVDRGWIAAPGSATQTPVAPNPPAGMVNLLGRARGLDSLDNPGVGGALFALPFKHPETIPAYISKHVASTNTVQGYIELVTMSPSGQNQPVPLETPVITPGPHLAYTVQWYLFAFLFLIGRIALGRDQYLAERSVRGIDQRSAN
ncbi:MAG TPA: SURF1 family protein [Candidatus Nanopelagicaceae bacterium]|nr:SURF1 family protein [Candidatus Nanopelagicaceae bacterium]